VTTRCQVNPDRTEWCARRRALCTLAVILFSMIPSSAPRALHRRALEQVAARYENRPVVVKSDLRASTTGSEGMLMPMFDGKGWHHTTGAVVLAPGTHAEITGVYNYSERGLVLEIARAGETSSEPLLDRPRVRVRVMTDVPSTDPDGQAAQATALIDRILALEAP
jgi:hypothetical protein